MVVDTMKPENLRVPVEPERVSRNGKRFFSEAHKRAVVEKCLVPGASVSAVAVAHGFITNLVRKWILNYQSRRALAGPAGTLVPVSVLEAPAKATRRSRRTAAKGVAEGAGGWIEIELGTTRVVVRGHVDAGQLRAVLDALGLW
jgi:transposase